MTHSYVIWLIHMWRSRCASIRWVKSFTCDMTHSCVIWHDLFMCDRTYSCVTWLIHMWYDSFTCVMFHSYVTWLVHMWHDSVVHEMTQSYVTWLIRIESLCHHPLSTVSKKKIKVLAWSIFNYEWILTHKDDGYVLIVVIVIRPYDFILGVDQVVGVFWGAERLYVIYRSIDI